MRRLILPFIIGMFCGFLGLCAGICFGPQLKRTPPAQAVMSWANRMPGLKSVSQTDSNSPIEVYNYPTIKWRAKPLSDPPGSIGQLWTKYEWTDAQHQSGKLDYRLTLFKAAKHQCQIQLLDDQGFKIMQFDVSDFHQVPGAEDISEARDSTACSEDNYKQTGDYVIISKD
jgi:hypothetical protein